MNSTESLENLSTAAEIDENVETEENPKGDPEPKPKIKREYKKPEITRAQRLKIIADDEKGVTNPNFEVVRTKAGKPMVRKRKGQAVNVSDEKTLNVGFIGDAGSEPPQPVETPEVIKESEIEKPVDKKKVSQTRKRG